MPAPGWRFQQVQHLRDHLPPEQPQRPRASALPLLTLQEVRYQYPGEMNTTLRPLNQFTRELVFVVGGNGSGKNHARQSAGSAFILRIAGPFLLNGSKIAADQQAGYRQLFSVVFSDFFF